MERRVTSTNGDLLTCELLTFDAFLRISANRLPPWIKPAATVRRKAPLRNITLRLRRQPGARACRGSSTLEAANPIRTLAYTYFTYSDNISRAVTLLLHH